MKATEPADDYELDDLSLEAVDFDGLIEEPEETVRYLDVHAIVIENEVAGRKFFNADNEQKQLDALLPGLPGPGECWKIIGGRRGFSCIGLIEYIAKQEPILELWMTTFRCDASQMEALDRLHADGILGYVCMIVSDVTHAETRTRNKSCVGICQKNGWDLCKTKNHSKIALLRTKTTFFVFETSANLNGNPRIEQYSFENSEEVYNFYKQVIVELREVNR